MTSNICYSLTRVIGKDILYHAKTSLLLLFLIAVSAIAVVITTYHTRRLTAKHALMIREQEKLDLEWQHLVLKENILSTHERIERIAIKKFHMQYVDLLKDSVPIYL